MTDRQAFPFDGAGDFKGWWVGDRGEWRVGGESQSRHDDPAACERLCVLVCVCLSFRMGATRRADTCGGVRDDDF